MADNRDRVELARVIREYLLENVSHVSEVDTLDGVYVDGTVDLVALAGAVLKHYTDKDALLRRTAMEAPAITRDEIIKRWRMGVGSLEEIQTLPREADRG